MFGEYVLSTEEKLTIACADVDRLLQLKNGDAALLYLLILRRGGYDPAAAGALGLKTPLNTCLAELVRLGLLQRQGTTPEQTPKPPLPPDTELPEYSTEDVTRRTREDPKMAAMMKAVSARMGRMLSGVEMNRLLAFHDYLGLNPEVIILLVNWCIESLQRRSHDGRMPTLKQLEREAYLWNRQGIDTLEAAERYMRSRREEQSMVNRIRALLGIQDRRPSPTEKKYLEGWAEMGFSEEAIGLAYDRTVMKKGNLSWAYMNSILTSWNEKNLHTVQEIRDGDKPGYARSRSASPTGKQAPNAEEMRRMQEYLKEMNGGGSHGT